jgi:hypothetical protein
MYDFMGHCEYVLAKDTNNKFTVLGKNKPCGDLSRRPVVTCTYTVTVIVKGLNIKILRGGLVQVSGRNINLPYNNQGKPFLYSVLFLMPYPMKSTAKPRGKTRVRFCIP